MTEHLKPVRTRPKSKTGKARRLNEPPNWNFKKYGLLYFQDVEEALKLQKKFPAAFEQSDRAQAIVAWLDDSSKWQVALEKASAAGIPSALRDLWIAGDRKLKSKKRLAAIGRFKRLIERMPMNVAIALFNWLDCGPKSELIKALNREVVVLQINPRTGALAEADERGRKKAVATIERLTLAAQRRNDGMSQRKMSCELFPGLPQQQAYARTRDLFLTHRYQIEILRHRLLNSPRPARKPRR